jgi:hypothetical protein
MRRLGLGFGAFAFLSFASTAIAFEPESKVVLVHACAWSVLGYLALATDCVGSARNPKPASPPTGGTD